MRKCLRAAGLLGIAFFVLFSFCEANAKVRHRAKHGTTKKMAKKHRHARIDGSSKVISLDTKSSRVKQLAKDERKPDVLELPEGKDTTCEDGYVEYRIKKGDTLDKLAARFNIDKTEIIDLNDMKKKRLRPGIKLFIPNTDDDSAEEEAPIVINEQRPLKPWRNEEERGILVKVAKSFTGAPYQYGGESVRGLDCSAFVKKMYEIFEVQLPRSAREQYFAGIRVNRDELATGDLVFFRTKRYAKYPTHVGIFIGEDRFIHASSTCRRGVKVDVLNEPYFARTYAGAVRVKGLPGSVEKTESAPTPAKTPGNNT
jgi:peptidoglycan DL-endopeptidase LytE